MLNLRNTTEASGKHYDVIIIGGGVYGIMLLMEASRIGLKAILVERSDFGSNTSFNSLRIIHGGLRYLQTLDLKRYFESVDERRWFLKTFPDLVKPLSCLMPLYNKGVRNRPIMWTALFLNDLLSHRRNRELPRDQQLPDGKILRPDQVVDLFPAVQSKGLSGGAHWYDAFMINSQRLLISCLKRASSLGGMAVNYTEVTDLLTQGRQTIGITAKDNINGAELELFSAIVINATGPHCRNLAKKFDKDYEDLFRPSLAWNILFDLPPLSDCALAVSSPANTNHTFFLLPWNGKILAGTGHIPWSKDCSEVATVPKLHIDQFLDDINAAVPRVDFLHQHIAHVYAGFLPVKRKDTSELSTRAVIVNHGNHNGPIGLFSVSGVKFTTARLVAENMLKILFPGKFAQVDTLPHEDIRNGDFGLFDFESAFQSEINSKVDQINEIMRSESVRHIEDFTHRRTNLIDRPEFLSEFTTYFHKMQHK